MPSSTDYLPTREADLVAWSTNFHALLTAAPAPIYGLLAPQVAAYTALHNAWLAAYGVANQNSTRTPSSIVAKNDAKQNLINGVNGIRQLVNIIQANPATTNQDRSDLQITVRDEQPSPAPIPLAGPALSVISTLGRSARIRLRDLANPDSRAKPEGVIGSTLFYFVGDAAPTDPQAWTFLANATRTLVDIDWPVAIAAGARVWLTAFWFNTRGESSPPSAEAISVRVGDTMAQAA